MSTSLQRKRLIVFEEFRNVLCYVRLMDSGLIRGLSPTYYYDKISERTSNRKDPNDYVTPEMVRKILGDDINMRFDVENCTKTNESIIEQFDNIQQGVKMHGMINHIQFSTLLASVALKTGYTTDNVRRTIHNELRRNNSRK